MVLLEDDNLIISIDSSTGQIYVGELIQSFSQRNDEFTSKPIPLAFPNWLNIYNVIPDHLTTDEEIQAWQKETKILEVTTLEIEVNNACQIFLRDSFGYSLGWGKYPPIIFNQAGRQVLSLDNHALHDKIIITCNVTNRVPIPLMVYCKNTARGYMKLGGIRWK
jgi:hypothetical protein